MESISPKTSDTAPRVAVLAIGTELTQGQITNRNATWISERLTASGFAVVHHAVVPDDRPLIRTALDFAAAQAELVVVTGGLGPTTDDFTRDCLAEWAGRPLEFREGAWTKIVRLLEKRGIEVAPSNRVQCFFPAGAENLENTEGTADGFRFSHSTGGGTRTTEILVLPGPPREGTHLWKTHVESWLRERFGDLAPPRLETWSCIGKSESSLGELVEKAVEGFGVKTGYRASMPYVEVKVWIPETLASGRVLELLAKMNAELAPYSVARNGEDIAERLLATLERATAGSGPARAITFLDVGSEGILAERLLGAMKSEIGRRLQTRIEILIRYAESADAAGIPERSEELLLGLFPHGEVVVVGPAGQARRKLPAPYSTPAMAERLRKYRTEMAIKTWNEILVSQELGEP